MHRSRGGPSTKTAHLAELRRRAPRQPAPDPPEVTKGQRGQPGSAGRRSVLGGVTVLAAVAQLEEDRVAHLRVEAVPVLLTGRLLRTKLDNVTDNRAMFPDF